MKPPILSIILPAHNRADVLPYAIHSILAQTIQDFELFVVGDGCTDNTAEVVQNFKDKRIKWLDYNKGKYYGYEHRNKALAMAIGKYIAYASHDDIILPDHFAKSIKIMEQQQSIELVCSRPLWVTRRGWIFPVEFNLNNPHTLENFIVRRHNAMPSTCVIHRRTCLRKYGYWNAALPSCGDWDMWARIIEGGKRKNFHFINTPTTLHFVAIWKEDDNGGIQESQPWYDFYSNSEKIPSTLKIIIPHQALEQAVIWQQMNQVGLQQWTRDIRRACIQVFDLRQEYLLKLSYEQQDFLVAQQEHIEHLKEYENMLAEVHASYSWKIGQSIVKPLTLAKTLLPFIKNVFSK